MTPRTTPPVTPPSAPRFDCTGLVVADMASSLAFYRRLGLDVPAEADDLPHVEHVLPNGLRLLWDTDATYRSFAPDTRLSTGPGRVTLGFACDGPAGVDAVWAELTKAGYTGHQAPWDAVWGQRYAIVLDPDGNAVDLFAALESPSASAG
ncbi:MULTISPECIES: VOC family protein [Streptomyces]|uniref:VOC family protein n=1 Tax=Streptomyces TaxID=1883 RepID=UPI00163B81DA|nr:MULTISPECIES: VOC family protein [Streptomyces]MBC2873565.1 VOC family protein [Streptomyces sp. TYQ1024]UBI36866.1 VOC family protein [Streptomyces mobaraensis]UKW29458.1 VOC family protein [Streptomyces sp. TYQ1024]